MSPGPVVLMSRTHLISTVANETACPRCHGAILTALDEGLPARVDTTPLPNHQAEIAALLTGRRTYTQLPTGELAHRDPDRITDPNLRGTIHAEHKCPPQPSQGELF